MSHTTRVSHVSGVPPRLADLGVASASVVGGDHEMICRLGCMVRMVCSLGHPQPVGCCPPSQPERWCDARAWGSRWPAVRVSEYAVMFVLVAIMGAGIPGPGDASLIAAG